MHPNQSLDSRSDGQRLTLQKQLTRERSPVEFTQIENALRHVRFAYLVAVLGKRKVNVVPLPGSLSTCIDP